MKKVILTICFLFSIFIVLDAQTFTYGDLQYTVNEDGFSATVASNQNFSDYTMAVLNIPQTVVYEGVSLEVTAIGDGAFNSHHDILWSVIKKVVLPSSITTIGKEAFFMCMGLEVINIPENTTYIGEAAFSGCVALKSVDLPDGLNELGASAFASCTAMESIHLPAGLEVIQKETFRHCDALTTIKLPDSLKRIEEKAFMLCLGLKEIEWGTGLEYIGYEAFMQCGALMTVEIPDYVTYVGVGAFSYCTNLKSVAIGTGLQTIGYGAFFSPGLTTVIYGAIDCNNREYYPGVQCEIFPPSVTSLTIKEGVKTIPSRMFAYLEELEEVHLPESLISIGEEAFTNCSGLKSVNFPRNLESVDNYAFSMCENLETVYYDAIDCKTSLGIAIAPVVNLFIGDEVRNLPDRCFASWNKITQVVLPSSLETIGAEAFASCTALESVTFGENIKNIGELAFSNCSSLSDVDLNMTKLTEIGGHAFQWCESITTFSVPELVNAIGETFLYGCKNIVTFNYNAIDCEDYNMYALLGCSVSKVNIGDKVRVIPSHMFWDSHSLESLVVPSSVESIGQDAFRNCGLNEVRIGDSVKEIQVGAFAGNEDLKSVVCDAVIPPKCALGAFDVTYNDDYEGYCIDINLTVPDASAEKYREASVWKYFRTINDVESSISDVTADASLSNLDGEQSISVYDLMGKLVYKGIVRLMPSLPHGTYVVNTSSRTSKMFI